MSFLDKFKKVKDTNIKVFRFEATHKTIPEKTFQIRKHYVADAKQKITAGEVRGRNHAKHLITDEKEYEMYIKLIVLITEHTTKSINEAKKLAKSFGYVVNTFNDV